MSSNPRQSQAWLDSAPPAPGASPQSYPNPQSYQNPQSAGLGARYQATQPPRSASLSGAPSYPTRLQQPNLYQSPAVPPPRVIPVVLFSLFFGVLGAISAYNRGKRAEALPRPLLDRLRRHQRGRHRRRLQPGHAARRGQRPGHRLTDQRAVVAAEREQDLARALDPGRIDAPSW